MLIGLTSCLQTVKQQFLQVRSSGECSCSLCLQRLYFTLQIVVSYMDSFKARKKSLGQIKPLGVSFPMERFVCVWMYDSGLFLNDRGSSVWIMAATISQSNKNLNSFLCRNMCEPVFTLYAAKMRKRETKRPKIEEKTESSVI